MEEYVTNPQTGRDIKVGGPTYEKLKHTINLNQLPRFVKGVPQQRHVMKPVSPQHKQQMAEMGTHQHQLKQTLEHTHQPAKIQKLEKEIQRKEQGRGRATRGWSAEAPQKGLQRHQLKEKCGNKCFLIPDSEGFPICPKCYEGKCTCEIDCRGLTAAKMRAHQFKYENLYEAIEQLQKAKC